MNRLHQVYNLSDQGSMVFEEQKAALQLNAAKLFLALVDIGAEGAKNDDTGFADVWLEIETQLAGEAVMMIQRLAAWSSTPEADFTMVELMMNIMTLCRHKKVLLDNAAACDGTHLSKLNQSASYLGGVADETLLLSIERLTGGRAPADRVAAVIRALQHKGRQSTEKWKSSTLTPLDAASKTLKSLLCAETVGGSKLLEKLKINVLVTLHTGLKTKYGEVMVLIAPFGNDVREEVILEVAQNLIIEGECRSTATRSRCSSVART